MIPNSLQQQKKRHSQHGVSYWFDERDDGTLELWAFERDETKTKPGDGAKALARICRMLDKTGRSLWLKCTVPKLFLMYEAAGCVCIYEQEPDPLYADPSPCREYERQPQRRD